MPTPHASSHRPRARLDPIRSAADALAVFSVQLGQPLRHETLVMLIDSSDCGICLLTVTGTTRADQVVDVADTIAIMLADRFDINGMVIASVRPRGGVLPDDDIRWFEADAAVDSHGLVLYDWLVIGRSGTRSMGDELGVPSRWPLSRIEADVGPESTATRRDATDATVRDC